MSSLHALVLGMVEGITEFLPVSSTGHLILTSHILGIPQTAVVKNFEIAIQLGAILAVVWLYGKRLMTDRVTIVNVLAAFVPTAIIGFLLHPFVKTFLLGNSTIVLWALLLGGIVLLVTDRFPVRKKSAMNVQQAFVIGCAQAVAIIPGVSRSGATIVGGLLLGIERREIVEFSFLLAIPTMLAATVLDLVRTPEVFTAENLWLLLIGSLAAFLTALAAVRWLLKYVGSHSFATFGWYRIALGALGLLLLWN